MSSGTQKLAIVLVVFSLVTATTIEQEVEEYTLLTAGLTLSENIISRDAKSIISFAKSKGFGLELFKKKLLAMMITKFIAGINVDIADVIINAIQSNSINSTLEEYAKVDYESLKDVILTEEEEKTNKRIENFLEEAKHKLHKYDYVESKAKTKNTFMDWKNLQEYILNNMKWIITIGVAMLTILIILCTFIDYNRLCM